MNIYIDFDDCISETAKYFSKLVYEMFGKDVPYEKMDFFNLQQSFKLNDDEYEKLIIKGHEPEILLDYEETPGASKTINSWIDKGYNVFIITGRPYNSYEPSRQWLDEHGLERVKLYCMDKYGREDKIIDSEHNLKLDDFYKMKFDFAVEDSPEAFKYFKHLPETKVNVFDRPWNRTAEFPGENFRRVFDWECIGKLIP